MGQAHAKPQRREGGMWWAWAREGESVVVKAWNGFGTAFFQYFAASRLRVSKSAWALMPWKSKDDIQANLIL